MPRPPKAPSPGPNTTLRSLREARNWTQAYVEQQVTGRENADGEQVRRWEKGEVIPGRYSRQKLKELYGVTTDEELGLGVAPSLPGESKSPPSASLEVESPKTSSSPQVQPVLPDAPVTTPVDPTRQRMLNRLQHTYQELHKQSLGGIPALPLNLTSLPYAVENATTILFRSPTMPEQSVPAGTSLLQVYDEAAQELLCLGASGAGKSTLLMELAGQLLERARVDALHPLPVLLPLASWAVRHLPLQHWLAEQMAEFYNIPKTLARQWISAQAVLPLLDGLDEMEESARLACLAAINTYQQAHPGLPLVVSCRLSEYEKAAQKQRLKLQHAVVIQPLKREQVEDYLSQGGIDLSALRLTLESNPAFREILSTPLMVYVAVKAYTGTSTLQLPVKPDLLEQRMLADFVAIMVRRKGDDQRYPLELTRAWLQWLARQMQNHHQAVLYLEHLQPDWLPFPFQRLYRWLANLFPAMVLGALISLLTGQLFLINLGILKGSGWLQIVTLGGLLGGLLAPRGQQKALSDRRTSIAYGASSLVLSAGIGLLLGFHQGWGYDLTPAQWLSDGVIYGLLFGLCSLLLLLLVPAFSRALLFAPRSASGWHASVAGFLSALHVERSLMIGPLTGLSLSLSAGLSHELISGPDIARAGLMFGLEWTIVSLFLSILFRQERLQEGVHLTERIALSWRGISTHLLSRSHVRRMLLFTASILAMFGLGVVVSQDLTNLSLRLQSLSGSHWFQPKILSLLGIRQLQMLLPGPDLIFSLSFGLSFGLSIGLLWWFLLGFYQSIGPARINDRERRFPNQGTWRSLHYSLLLGPFIGALIASLQLLTFASAYGLEFWLNSGQPAFGWRSGLDFGLNLFWSVLLESTLLFWLLTGGLAVWRHLIIRLLLSLTQTFPWSASRFLDDATTRVLLQRLDGGYRFMHPLLLTFLADPDAHAAVSSPLTNGAARATHSPHPTAETALLVRGTGLKPSPQFGIASHHARTTGFALCSSFIACLLFLSLIWSYLALEAILTRPATLANNPYLPSGQPGTLAFFDPLNQELTSQWNSNLLHWNGTCQFRAGAYLISARHLGYSAVCYMGRAVQNGVFEAHLTILQGDCGGLVWRDDGTGHFYFFQICQDGTFAVRKYVAYSPTSFVLLHEGTSPFIRTGLGQANTIAVAADGDRMALYVDMQKVFQARDGSYHIGLMALFANTQNRHVTDVAFRDARLWVLSQS